MQERDSQFTIALGQRTLDDLLSQQVVQATWEGFVVANLTATARKAVGGFEPIASDLVIVEPFVDQSSG